MRLELDIRALEKIVDTIEFLFTRQFLPKRGILPPVAWRRRTFNKLADSLANAAMNHKRCMQWFSDDWTNLEGALSKGACLQMHSDGGVRYADGCAATAFTIVAYTPTEGEYVRSLLYASCSYIPNAITPFRAECMALCDAITTLRDKAFEQ